jgi:hypothetical protein
MLTDSLSLLSPSLSQDHPENPIFFLFYSVPKDNVKTRDFIRFNSDSSKTPDYISFTLFPK